MSGSKMALHATMFVLKPSNTYMADMLLPRVQPCHNPNNTIDVAILPLQNVISNVLTPVLQAYSTFN